MLSDRNFSNYEKCSFTCLYRSPSQRDEKLDTFCFNLDTFFSNINDNHPICLILLGEFNVKCSEWCSINNYALSDLGNITTSASYSQLIINQLILLINLLHAFIWSTPLTRIIYLNQIVELNHQFIKDFIIILSTKHYILTYLFHVNITGWFEIKNVRILKIFKGVYQCLIGKRLSGAK